MAIRSIVLVLFARFLVSASATYCLHSSDCISDLQTCCSDHVCRQTCYFCSYDYQCGSEECCSPNGNCWMKCSDGGCRKDCFYCCKDSECDAGRGASAAGIATAGRNTPMESAEDSVSIAWLVRSAELESAVTIRVTVSSIVPRPYM